MLLASALGLIKLLGLAYIMPVHEYGQYIVSFGVGTLAATLMSFGLIERTIKAYPRQWVSGERNAILTNAASIAYVISKRFFGAGFIFLCLSYYKLVAFSIDAVILTVGLGLCTSWLALLGSLYRAAGSQKALQSFSWWRSCGTLCIVLPAGLFLGWQGALTGEIAANFAGILFGVRQIKRLFKNQPLTPAVIEPNSAIDDDAKIDRGHQHLYFSNVAVLIVNMLDKAWVNAAIGAVLAGSYAVVMLIPQVAQLLVNVVVQHIGPLIIKLVYMRIKDKTAINALGLQAGLLALFSIILTLSALIAKRTPHIDYLFEKFSISDMSLLMAGVIAAGQIYSVFEFHLIAYNREKDVLQASLLSLGIFIILFSMASFMHADMEWFIAAMAVSRWGQVWLLQSAHQQNAKKTN